MIQPKAATTVVLVGKTGTGKSSTANLIVGRDNAFYSQSSSSGVTLECRMADSDDGQVTVIDTPGFIDMETELEEIVDEVGKSVDLAMRNGGMSALLLVFNLATRITDEDITTIEILSAIFGPTMLQRTIVVWTHAEELRGLTLDDYLENAGCRVKEMFSKCSGSVLVEHFPAEDPESEKTKQRAAILAKARLTQIECGGLFTADMKQDARLEFSVRRGLGFRIIGPLRRKQRRRVRQFKLQYGKAEENNEEEKTEIPDNSTADFGGPLQFVSWMGNSMLGYVPSVLRNMVRSEDRIWDYKAPESENLIMEEGKGAVRHEDVLPVIE